MNIKGYLKNQYILPKNIISDLKEMDAITYALSFIYKKEAKY